MELVTVSTVLVPAVPAYSGQGAYDLVALDAITQELRDCNTRLYPAILSWITQASAACIKFIDRVPQIETVQDLFYPPRDYWPAPTVIGGLRPLQLTRYPIACSPSPAGTPPPLAPVLSYVPGGALAKATYYVKITYVTPTGETATSLEATLVVPANNLLVVAGPIADGEQIAVGWNCYIGTASWGETLQNSDPLQVGSAFTLPSGGLVDGAAMPNYILVVENNNPLAEGQDLDFIVKKAEGQLIRLDSNGYPRRWPAYIDQIQYPSGFDVTLPIFQDLADAVTRMVRDRYFARDRDGRLRSENTVGVYEATYWFGSGPGAEVKNLAPDVQAILEMYRVPVCGA
jgi:hypothetical protein